MIAPINPKPPAAPSSPDDRAERARLYREAEEVQRRAHELGGFGKHPESFLLPFATGTDLIAAVGLYERAIALFEKMGNRRSEIDCARAMVGALHKVIAKAEKVA